MNLQEFKADKFTSNQALNNPKTHYWNPYHVKELIQEDQWN